MARTLLLEQPLEMNYRNDALLGGLFHSHAFYEIYYFHEGECNYLIGDKLYALRPGDLILMHGMTLHSANPSPNLPYVRTIVHFDPGYVHRLLQAEPASALLRPFEELRNYRISLGEADREKADGLLLRLSESYAARRSGGIAPFDWLDVRLLELLQQIREWCAHPIESLSPASERESLVQQAISYIEEHYPEDLSLEDIAAALHLSKPYLSNLFKKVTGTTIFKYLHNRRVNQAKVLFRFDPRQQVAEVGRRVGYAHPAHFSRLFKELAGIGPEAYRKRMEESASR